MRQASLPGVSDPRDVMFPADGKNGRNAVRRSLSLHCFVGKTDELVVKVQMKKLILPPLFDADVGSWLSKDSV